MLCSAVLLPQSAKEASSVVCSPSLSSLDIVYLHQLLLPPYSRHRLIGHAWHTRTHTYTHTCCSNRTVSNNYQRMFSFRIPPVFLSSSLLHHSLSLNVLTSYYPYPSRTKMPKQNCKKNDRGLRGGCKQMRIV